MILIKKGFHIVTNMKPYEDKKKSGCVRKKIKKNKKKYS